MNMSYSTKLHYFVIETDDFIDREMGGDIHDIENASFEVIGPLVEFTDDMTDLDHAAACRDLLLRVIDEAKRDNGYGDNGFEVFLWYGSDYGYEIERLIGNALDEYTEMTAKRILGKED